MDIDITRVVITIINFGILFFILWRILYKPVDDKLTSRQEEIQNTIKSADENKVKAEKYVAESEANLKDSRNQGKTIVEDYKKRAETLSEEIKNEANKEAQIIMERATKEAEREKLKAESEIRNQVVDLAVLLSSKALEKSIDEEEHRRLINDFIAKVGI
ncbi:F0F1 ATP synthase subunit B [Clostridium sp. 19966]|uniref:F0F1 ATP synthase subunit B n=1 Tax=Clostridium sp. 19966 TaxID=2768166 RepID=UPI0028E074BB|nr:F0F1 ATP synthase subunit B [Clostridium sp. 19966]MDT8715588.1 F0F1 ATP synthase subunit B [Clostridium sp. 19966]